MFETRWIVLKVYCNDDIHKGTHVHSNYGTFDYYDLHCNKHTWRQKGEDSTQKLFSSGPCEGWSEFFYLFYVFFFIIGEGGLGREKAERMCLRWLLCVWVGVELVFFKGCFECRKKYIVKDTIQTGRERISLSQKLKGKVLWRGE